MSNKVDDFLSGVKLGELLNSKKEEERKRNTWVIVLAIIGAIVTIAIVAYTVYKVLTPDDYEDEFDEFEDGFNDFDDDDDDEAPIVELKAVDDTDLDANKESTDNE